ARRVTLDKEHVKAYGYGKPGEYALITVADTGLGMDEQTREKIFEPFFTTKGLGKGTGLGLSIIYGIIKQHNGYINVYSEIGKGTIFKIYLPTVESVPKETAQSWIATPKGGTETILLAEDDTAVRELTKRVLEEFGYTVIETSDGEDAINVFVENKDQIDLLILDVLMPKKTGKEVYEEIMRMRPNIKTILISGYTKDLISKKGVVEEGLNFVEKPISPTELVKRIRETLDGGDKT
ncbi:MAG TPA: response regulator, partial [Thermodesulfovibrionales bacterium]|nr:response regulator [Thermodesulfovibrionales bacterium]